MTPKRQQQILEGRTALSRRLFEYVPIAEGWTAHTIGTVAREKESMTTAIRILEGALRDLVDVGLVKQKGNTYRRVAVSEPVPPKLRDMTDFPQGPEIVSTLEKAVYVETTAELVIAEGARHPVLPTSAAIFPIPTVNVKEVPAMAQQPTPIAAVSPAPVGGSTHKQLVDIAIRLRGVIATQQTALAAIAEDLDTVSVVIEDEYVELQKKLAAVQVLQTAMKTLGLVI